MKVCTDSIAKQILVENNLIYYFPSSFTPNDDGLNDEFGVSGFRIDNIQYNFKLPTDGVKLSFIPRILTQNGMVKHLMEINVCPVVTYGQFIIYSRQLGKVTRKFGDFTLIR